MNLSFGEKIVVFVVKSIILIIGFMFWVNLSHGLLYGLQRTCNNISQTREVYEQKGNVNE